MTENLLRTPPRDIALPAVVLYELESGIDRLTSPDHRRALLDELVSLLTILPFGPAEARAAARIRSGLERQGLSIGPLDTLIAGTAISHGVTLVTHNVDEFGRVEGLAIVDWY
ncbi:MAG: PIN domain-containing protein [Thermoanaerobaculia bacterium]